MARVSIIVSAYNIELYLKRCVNSLLNQSVENIEIIIVDDGATDTTGIIADGLANEDSRIRVIHQENQGLSAARNSGIQAATGEYLCFVDGDDWVNPNMVDRMLMWMEKTEADVGIAGFIVDIHDADDQLISSATQTLEHGIIQHGKSVPAEDIDWEFINILGYAWNKFYRRNWFLKVGQEFEVGLKLVEDIDFNSRVLPLAERIVLVPEEFVHYIQRPRATLGTLRDENYLQLRLRAVESVDHLLSVWRVDEHTRLRILSQLSTNALSAALSAATKTDHPVQSIKRMMNQPGVSNLVKHSRYNRWKDWRSFGVNATLNRGFFIAALIPARLRQLFIKA